METSLKAAEEYQIRAERELAEARDHLKRGYVESAVSTAYYSCFYAVHSQLARLGVVAKSHKQAGIAFRRHFVQSRKMDPQYSRTWAKLSQWRMTVDYAPLPEVSQQKATELVQMAEDFVTTLLAQI